MDLKARVDINCKRKDGWTENQTPMLHTAKAGATKKKKKNKTAKLKQNEGASYIIFENSTN